MGCGGSRADALEPRYLESWTRDTESTWLTGSDADAGPDAGEIPQRNLPFDVNKTALKDPSFHFTNQAILKNEEKDSQQVGGPEDGPSPRGPRHPEQSVSGGSAGPPTRKQKGLWTAEAQRDAQRMSAKEVTITVPDSLRQMDRSNRITKNCVN